MAVIAVTELWSGRRGSFDAKTKREYLRKFRVQTASPYDGTVAIFLSPALPRLFSFYVDQNGYFDLGSVAQKITPTQLDEDPCLWDVEIEYSSETPDPAKVGMSSSGSSPDPAQVTPVQNRPPEVKVSSEVVMVPALKDIDDGTPVLNSSKEPFDPPAEKEEDRVVLTVTRNELFFSFSDYLSWNGAINSDKFQGKDPHTWKLKIEADSAYENNASYWKVTYTLRYNPETWDGSYLDQGYHILQGGSPRVILDSQGQPLSSPVLLDGGGHRLAVGGVPFYLTVRHYRTKRFADLGLFL